LGVFEGATFIEFGIFCFFFNFFLNFFKKKLKKKLRLAMYEKLKLSGNLGGLHLPIQEATFIVFAK
jgi:hypothetical protein